MIDMVYAKKRYLEFLSDELDKQIMIIRSVYQKLEESFLNDQKPILEEIQIVKDEQLDPETEESIIDFLSEEGLMLEEMKHLAQANVVTLLYHYLENQTKKALMIVGISKRISKLGKLMERIENIGVINNRSLDLVCYDEIQEIRIINNRFKHNSGIANAKLAQINSKWVEGEIIIVSESDITRFQDYVSKFLSSLISKIEQYIK